jgi:hypothetical protein
MVEKKKKKERFAFFNLHSRSQNQAPPSIAPFMAFNPAAVILFSLISIRNRFK